MEHARRELLAELETHGRERDADREDRRERLRWEDLVRVLDAPGFVLVDDATSHAEEMREFRALAEADERVVVTLMGVGAGVLAIARA